MKWSANLMWLALSRDRRRARADEDDRAGMGTAFGLDASLPTMPMHALEPEPSTPTKLLPDSTPWAHRLARRSSL